jgi:hypothetical protein
METQGKVAFLQLRLISPPIGVQEIVSFAFTSRYDSSRSLGATGLNIAGTVVAEPNELKAGLERKLQSGGRAFFR